LAYVVQLKPNLDLICVEQMLGDAHLLEVGERGAARMLVNTTAGESFDDLPGLLLVDVDQDGTKEVVLPPSSRWTALTATADGLAYVSADGWLQHGPGLALERHPMFDDHLPNSYAVLNYHALAEAESPDRYATQFESWEPERWNWFLASTRISSEQRSLTSQRSVAQGKRLETKPITDADKFAAFD
jgi:hypothetical protein